MPCGSKGKAYGKTNPHPKDGACAGQLHHDLPEVRGSYRSTGSSTPRGGGGSTQRGTGPANERGYGG